MLDLSVINNSANAAKYQKGTIFGATGGLHIILEGRAGIIVHPGQNNQRLSGTLSPGDFFGETSLCVHGPSLTAIVALTDMVTLSISQNDAEAFFRSEPGIAFELIKALCSRLQQISDAYYELSGRPWISPASVNGIAPARQTAVPVKTRKAETVSPTSSDNSPRPAAPPDVGRQQAAASPASNGSDGAQGNALSLFPEGHGQYDLHLDNKDRTHLLEKNFACPICGKSFQGLVVRPSRLVLEKADSDMRQHFKGVEPLYYDVITCPYCLYSALSDMFDSPNRKSPELIRDLEPLQKAGGFRFGLDSDTSSVFAGYYLALLCAPRFFSLHHLATAKLLLKLCRIYQDCGDSRMETVTAKRALEAYLYVYENIKVPPSQEQQLCLIIGELYLKLGNAAAAKNFFFKVKIYRDGAPLLQRQAENRLYDIRQSKA